MRVWLTRAIATTLLCAGSVAPSALSAQAADTSTVWSLSLSGETQASHLVSDTTGGLQVGCGTAVFRTVTTTGSLADTVAGPFDPRPAVCQTQSALDRDGRLFAVATDNDGSSYIVAYQGTDQLWRHKLPCPVDDLQVGADGNVLSLIHI